MIEIIKPKISPEAVDNEPVTRRAKFVVEPLERSFGITVGNALRRVLLGSLPGAAAVGIRIDGVRHEFSTIPGVKEDVAEIILNIKSLAIKAHTEDKDFEQVMYIKKNTAGVVTAADIEHSSDIDILNPSLYICTLDEGAKFDMEITVGVGRGYVSADKNKDESKPLGYIAVDSIFTPVERASYEVTPARVGQCIDYDKLTIDITTNGTASPSEVISLSAKIINDLLGLFIDLVENMGDKNFLVSKDDEKQHKVLEMQISELELSVRSYNCLKRAGIDTVQDLIQRSEEDMLKVRNLGKKSLEEVLNKIHELGFELQSKDE